MLFPYRTALVTGASGPIGSAFAQALAARGVDLVLVARRRESLTELAGLLTDRYGTAVEVICADLADPELLSLVEKRVAAPDRPIDLLVNNAGHPAQPVAPFAGQDLAANELRLAVNVGAVVRLTYAALPGMLARRHGGVLNVSSFSSLVPQPNGAVYAATKAFVTSFSESLYCEVEPYGVHVTALCPGFTRRAGGAAARGGRPAGPDGAAGERGGMKGHRMPAFLWLDRDDVVREGLAAVAAGDALCVPGRSYRALAGFARAAPRSMVRRAFQRLWGGPPRR